MAKAKNLAVIIFVSRVQQGMDYANNLFDKGHKIACIVGKMSN